MKVRDLIAILEQFDQDKEVIIFDDIGADRPITDENIKDGIRLDDSKVGIDWSGDF